MNLLNLINPVSLGISAASAVGGVLLWKGLNFAWDMVKPLKPFTDYAVSRASKWGNNTRGFIFSRIKDTSLREKIIDDLVSSEDKIAKAFKDGLLGN